MARSRNRNQKRNQRVSRRRVQSRRNSRRNQQSRSQSRRRSRSQSRNRNARRSRRVRRRSSRGGASANPSHAAAADRGPAPSPPAGDDPEDYLDSGIKRGQRLKTGSACNAVTFKSENFQRLVGNGETSTYMPFEAETFQCKDGKISCIGNYVGEKCDTWVDGLDIKDINGITISEAEA